MSAGALIRHGISELGAESENTISAAREVMTLGTVCASEYADAIMGQNGYGGYTAEIYFYRFAQGFPSPGEHDEFRALMSDPQKSAEYRDLCYRGWREELQCVQEIVARRRGVIEVEGMAFESYLRAVQEAGETPDYRVHVRISVPGQRQLCFVSEMDTLLNEFTEDQTAKARPL